MEDKTLTFFGLQKALRRVHGFLQMVWRKHWMEKININAYWRYFIRSIFVRSTDAVCWQGLYSLRHCLRHWSISFLQRALQKNSSKRNFWRSFWMGRLQKNLSTHLSEYAIILEAELKKRRWRSCRHSKFSILGNRICLWTAITATKNRRRL